ncbi:MAG: hypothetical protein WBX27_21325 [Specibacter sp.]
MTTPDEQPQERPATGPRPGNYGEIAPGVPRYGQYAPEGWTPPTESPVPGAAPGLPPSATYPGFQGGPPQGPGYPHRGAGPIPPGAHFAAPKQVVLATRFIQMAGVLQALSAVLLLVVLLVPAVRTTMIDALKSSMPNGASYDAVFADPSMVTVVLVMAAILSVVGASAYFWLAAKIRKGASWARTTGLVLAIISLLALTQPNVFTILQIGLGVAAMVILYRSPAKEYFAKAPANKGPHGY